MSSGSEGVKCIRSVASKVMFDCPGISSVSSSLYCSLCAGVPFLQKAIYSKTLVC